MMSTNHLVDCLLSILSYGTPSISFLLSLGKELQNRKFSASNFQHTNRILKSCVLLKSYFKDPLFISDPEWKENALSLFETYQKVFLENISPVIEQQTSQYKKLSFNPRLYFENLGLICFLNGVFQAPRNLQYLIVQSEKIVQYYCLWYSFFRKQLESQETIPLLASAFSSSDLQLLEETLPDESQARRSKTFFWNRLPRQLDLDDLLKIVYSSQKANYQIFDYEHLLDFFSSNLLRIGTFFADFNSKKNTIWLKSCRFLPVAKELKFSQ